MTVRAWATLAVRCFALYHIFVSVGYILWQIGARIMGAGGALRGVAESGPEFAASLLYSLIYIALAVVLLALSDGIIRFIARIPGEPERRADAPLPGA